MLRLLKLVCSVRSIAPAPYDQRQKIIIIHLPSTYSSTYVYIKYPILALRVVLLYLHLTV